MPIPPANLKRDSAASDGGGGPAEPTEQEGRTLGRIQPVQIPAPNPHLSGDATVDRLAEILALTRRQLKSLYQRFQETQTEVDTGSLPSVELADLKSRMDRLERALAARAVAESRIPTADHVLVEESAEPQLAQSPLERIETAREDGQRRPRAIDRFLRLMVERGASDMHLSVGCAPMFRNGGEIEPLRYRRLREEDWDRLLGPITPAPAWNAFKATGDADFAYELPEIGRFRVNVFRQERGGAAVLRVIPTKILTIDQLALPEQVHRIAGITGGLVLVTGPTGSGKSTTLAAIIDKINETRGYHVVTLEDPIEFVHHDKRSLIHQREIGTHAVDFTRGLRDAVREDPNLLLVGEMRDVETIRLALESAEKGLLVFGTLHTNNAAKTIDRVINSFAADEQESTRAILADTVRAILAQQLLKKVEGGRVAAVEILFGSPALATLIRDGKTHQVTNLIQTGSRQGMISMDDSLKALLSRGVISRETAHEKAIDKSLFRDPEAARMEAEATRSSG